MGIHRLVEPLLILLVVAHLAAIVFYVRVRKETLIMPMITGRKVGAGNTATGGGVVAFCIALAIGLTAVYGVSGAWLPVPPVAAASETPAW